jgi:hypothetical protein
MQSKNVVKLLIQFIKKKTEVIWNQFISQRSTNYLERV